MIRPLRRLTLLTTTALFAIACGGSSGGTSGTSGAAGSNTTGATNGGTTSKSTTNAGATTNGGASTNGGTTNKSTTASSQTTTGNSGSTTAKSTTGAATASASATATTGGAPTTTGGAPTTGGSSGGTGPTLGSACALSSQGDDPCVPAGYTCDLNTSTCQVPTEFGLCDSTVGCNSDAGVPSLQCVQGFQEPDSGVTGSMCIESCTGPGPTGCNDPIATCQNLDGDAGPAFYACYYNICDLNGGPYFNACNVTGTGDGECLPVPNGPTGLIGLCTKTGSAAADATCNPFVSGNNLCASGSLCEQGTTAAACLPTCDAAGGASNACPSGQQCEGLYAADAGYGLCIETCTSGGTACPGTLTCQTPQAGGGSICLPQ